MTNVIVARSTRPAWVSLLSTFIVIVATVAVALEVFGPLHSVKGTTLLVVVCFIELLFGVFWAAFLMQPSASARVSSATLAIMGGVIAGYALTVVVSIFVVMTLTLFSNSGMHAIAALIIGWSALWLTIAITLYSHDVNMTQVAAPLIAIRSAHVACAKQIQEALVVMRSSIPIDDRSRLALDRLCKQLESAAAALLHSHGGGGGEHTLGESASSVSVHTSNVEQETGRLDKLAHDLRSAQPEEYRNILDSLSACALDVSSDVSKLGLE